jgi:hypothetical protein
VRTRQYVTLMKELEAIRRELSLARPVADAGDPLQEWQARFIDGEITYYRATYTSIEERAGFFSTFASGLGALLFLWVSDHPLGGHGLTLQLFFFVLTLALLALVVFCSVSAMRPHAGRSSIFGTPLFARDIVQFYRGASRLKHALKQINDQSFDSSARRIAALEEAWLIVEPNERYVSFGELDDPDLRTSVVAARLTMLLSFRRHVQLKAFYIGASGYSLLLSIVAAFCLLVTVAVR